jgi:hypothetical protein
MNEEHEDATVETANPDTVATVKPIDQLSLTELVRAYNRRAEELEANHTGLKPVVIKRIKGFKDRATGIRRLSELNGVPVPAKAVKAKAEPAAKKAKPKKAEANPKKSQREFTNSIGQEFGFKAGGERDHVLQILSSKMGRQVPRKEFGEFGKFVSKVDLRIKRKKLKYKLVKEKDDEAGYSYGLHRK